MKYLKHTSFVIFYILFCWWASIQLTHQRILVEAKNKQISINSGSSQFDWGFDEFSEVVTSFQPDWQHSSGQIIPKTNNPKLSLNFSGSSLIASEHTKLIISSSSQLSGPLTLEFKTDLDDDLFYYSPKYPLNEKQHIIDLNATWRGVDSNKTLAIKAPWGTAKNRVASLVLHFENLASDTNINSIKLTSNNKPNETIYQQINCSEFGSQQFDDSKSYEINLSNDCLSSNQLMEINSKTQSDHPNLYLNHSQLSNYVSTNDLTINQDYSKIWPLNLTLYLLVLLGFLYVMIVYFKHPKPTESEDLPWYRWLIRKVLFQKLILPHYFILSYGSILLPSIFLVIIMAIVNFPSLSILSEWPRYFLWAVVQQFFLGYILAEKVFNKRLDNIYLSSLFAGFVFSLLHLPSTTLMLATFIAGCSWAFAWLLFQRFIPLALSHSILALMFYNTIPEKYLHTAKVLQWFWK